MLEEARQRLENLQKRMRDGHIPIALFTDESSIAYLAGFWGYLGIEFGRPTMLVVRSSEDPVVVTPRMESEMVSAMTWVEDVRVWEDAGSCSWQRVLGEVIGDRADEIWIESATIPAIVRTALDDQFLDARTKDISPILGAMRMIKSPFEIAVMKQAGCIATTMMNAAYESLGEGVPEYHSALAIIKAGTESAAGFLTDKGWEHFVSPVIHNLQIMQSGHETSMVHRRASTRRYERGDPVYFCLCNMAQFKQYKLGFDRMFYIGMLSKEAERVQLAAIDAQQAAIAAIRPGVLAEDVAAAANDVYRSRGYQAEYRAGRAIGVAYLEAPELKAGDKTVLLPGMTFAVDGGISVDGVLAGRIGDSIVVTEDGCEYITDYSRQLLVTER